MNRQPHTEGLIFCHLSHFVGSHGPCDPSLSRIADLSPILLRIWGWFGWFFQTDIWGSFQGPMASLVCCTWDMKTTKPICKLLRQRRGFNMKLACVSHAMYPCIRKLNAIRARFQLDRPLCSLCRTWSLWKIAIKRSFTSTSGWFLAGKVLMNPSAA